MVSDNNLYKKNTNDILIMTDIIIDIITNKDTPIEKTDYYFHNKEKQVFLIYIYLLKLLINTKDNINKSELIYINKIIDKLNSKTNISNLNIKKISNINVKTELELLKTIKDDILNYKYYYNKLENRIYFSNDDYIDIKWLLHILILYLDNNKETTKEELTINYIIPKKDIEKCFYLEELDEFFKQFDFYKIKISCNEEDHLEENTILVLKNASNNYLKHLKKYKRGEESEEAYLIFYNLLKNECHKQGYKLEEQIRVLSELDEHYLRKIKSYITNSFTSFDVNKQIITIENTIWKLNNTITLLETNNTSMDYLIELLSHLHKKEQRLTYHKLKWTYNLHDVRILEMLIITKFTGVYLHDDNINYKQLNLTNFNPAYMSSVPNKEVEDIKIKIKELERELSQSNNELDEYKFERQSISKEVLGEINYKNKLEICIGNINRISIVINTIKANIENLYKEYEESLIKQSENNKESKYNNNYSIIKHILSSILSSSFYLKTNNNNHILENIIIFEDYTNTDNAFYLEVTFKDLLDICESKKIEKIEELDELPKLK